ncbi:MAG: hypothetical protein CMG46_05795 [Candidatus Marinimicrobia bacterium]|nr:hypothetical protein [Candidatus Neomarinimicrobiota bacterium]
MKSKVKLQIKQSTKFLLLFVAANFLAAPSCAQDKSAFSNNQREELKVLVREYILENPEIISEAIMALQVREERAKSEKQAQALTVHKTALLNPTEGTIIGNPDGDITVVEFFDYNCGYCKSMVPAIQEILEEDKNLRMVMKEFPILGQGSLIAARAALASHEQGKYEELHMALLSHKGPLNQQSVIKIANSIGIDVSKLVEDMKNPKINDVLAKNMALAQDLGIEGTPALVIGDTLVPGAIGKNRLLELIADARK